jgi:DNA-binding NarL/FixJ family response regulator
VPAYLSRVKVLVVDDNVSVRERLAALLAEIPGVAEVFECGDSAQAVDLLKAHAPEIVVLDLHLRGESGLAFAPQVKNGNPRTLLIVLTNEASPRHRRECLARGADHFLDKSRDLDVLLDVVARRCRPLPPEA